jgi:sugar phosphate isomerase/epimerase
LTASPDPLTPGLCSVTFRGREPAEIIDLARECRLRAIEWGADVHVPPGSDGAAIAARCADAGIDYLSYGSYLGVDGPIGDASAVLDTAVALGARNVRVWCPLGMGPDASVPGPIAAGLAAIADAASERGLTVSLEFHPRTLTETAASTLRVLDAVDAPNLFTYWQPAPGAPADYLRHELAAVRDHLSHLHVFWWTASSRLPLEDGAAAWASLLPVADGSRWRHPRAALLEFVAGDEPDQLRRDAAVLRTLIGAE